MGYAEELRPASFRGVPFFVEDTTLVGGKRAQIHEYEERDVTWPEELGAKSKTFPVVAHLLGDDVIAQRERLIQALDLKGSGTLVLPVDGEIEATCLDYRIRDSVGREGRISRLGLTFVKAGKNQFPEATVETRQVVRDQGVVGIEAVEGRFSDLFKMPPRQPNYVVDAAVQLSTEILNGIDAAIRRSAADSGERDTALRTNKAFVSDMPAQVQAPATLASQLTASYRALVDLDAPSQNTFDELDDLVDLLASTPAVASGTTHRARQAQNQAALQDLNRRTAAIEMARTATDITLVSSNDAAALRDQIDARLGAEILAAGDAGDDQVFAQLRELRAKTVQDLDARGARLPTLRTFTVPATLPALVIAARLYGDSTREAEIVARNGIRAPGFIRSHRELEVLAE